MRFYYFQMQIDWLPNWLCKLWIRQDIRKAFDINQIFSDLEKEDAQHDDIPLIKDLLLFHAGNLSFIERTCAQGILAVLRCGKPLQKNLKEASYKKAL
uniref:Uncharacterized protein n=2 Tax=Meloidogyne TaxID=189290 RepID=A0A6V7UXH8_MELEN|nr:unnamed protein product [Meloidogyne enterolobii]CAD2183336.1 unnamed protein product [Meloidogyne enterolobii]